MVRGQRCEDGKETRKREREKKKNEGVEENELKKVRRWCAARGEGYRCQGTMEPSNLLRWPRAPFNETRLMQLIDHLGMH